MIESGILVTNSPNAQANGAYDIVQLSPSVVPYWTASDKTAVIWYNEERHAWCIQEATIVNTTIDYKTLLYYAESESTIMPYDARQIWMTAGETPVPEPNIKLEYWDESSLIRTVRTSIDADGAQRSIVTFTNTVTGNVYTETSIVRDKTRYNTQVIERMDYQQLCIGKIYRFQFVPGFNKLGWDPTLLGQPLNAGVYRVDKILSYADLMMTGVNLYTNIYVPCGISKEVYEQDKNRLEESTVYRLSDPIDQRIVYYMPQIFFKAQPDPSVIQYDRLILCIDLGIQPNEAVVGNDPASSNSQKALSDFNEMKDTLKKVLEKKYGIIPEGGAISITTYDHIWMTDNSFGSVYEQREHIKSTSPVDLVELLGFERTNAIYNENRKLKGTVSALEETIRQLMNSKKS